MEATITAGAPCSLGMARGERKVPPWERDKKHSSSYVVQKDTPKQTEVILLASTAPTCTLWRTNIEELF